MTLQSLLTDLRANKVSIWSEGDKLRYRTAEGALSPALRARITEFRAELIDLTRGHKTDAKKTHALAPVSRSVSLPLSYAEERLWFMSSLSMDKPVFQLTFAFDLIGQINESVLEQCFKQLVCRHEVLRTRYRTSLGNVYRDIGHDSDFQLPIIQADSDVDSTMDDAISQYVRYAQRRKLNLGREAAFQPRLLKVSDTRHVLVVTLHHIIYDEQSLRMFWQELSATYNAMVSGKPVQPPVHAFQYADFAHWQRSNTDAQMELGIQYWQRKLADIPWKIDLPTDYTRTTQPKFSGQRLTRRLTAAQQEGLRHLCLEHNLTKYMALLAIFSLLMHRYSRQSTVLVGSPVSNRHYWTTESMLGCFMDTVVLRTDFDESLPTREFFQSVKQSVLEAFEFQHVPFEKVVEVLRPERNTGCHPIFQVMFNFLNRHEEQPGPHLDGLSVTRIGKDDHTDISAEFDIKLTVIEHSDEMTVAMTYNSDLFLRESIDRMTDHFMGLLDSASRHPQMPVKKLPMLTTREQKTMLRDWNATGHVYPTGSSACALFEQQARATPNSVALVDTARKMTYRELNRRANLLAWHLRSLDIEPQAVVGVHLDRSIEVTIALLAIFKINGVYLPLDTSYPSMRLQGMLESSHASCLLDSKDTVEPLEFNQGVRIHIEAPYLNKTGQYDNLEISSGPDDIAYIIYTSGSTGAPKAVYAPHLQLLNRLHWMWRHYPFLSSDVSCQKSAISFIDSLWELLGPLLQGSPSIVMNAHTARDPIAFMKFVTDEKVTRLWAVPTLLELLLDTVERYHLVAPSINFMVVSGESLPVNLVVKLNRLWPQVSLYNVYGTSESWDSSWYPVPQMTSTLASPWVPIGKPIDNTQLYILDDLLNPVPIGVTGQLHVGGHGLPANIIEDTTHESARFCVLPWQPAQQVLALGDLARFQPDGTIELVGRESQIINVRGYRVEPAEVEQALCAIEGITNAILVQKSLLSGGQFLMACLVLSSDMTSLSRSDWKRIRNQLKTQLPAYMIPNRFQCLAQFPLTPSGKIDRSRLASMEIPQSDEAASKVDQPDTQTQADILALWKKVLDRDDIEVDDDFFDLGGHSLLAVELFAKLCKLAGSEIEMTSLFHASTVYEQAQLIERRIDEKSSETLVVVKAAGSAIPLFLIPPAGGTGLNYRRLFSNLSNQQPLYTFDLSKSEATLEAQGSIENMASRYIEEMYRAQTEGPYIIGGMCFGGVIAWEMAHQIQQSGREVACIILLDPTLPGYGPIWANLPVSVRMPYVSHFYELLHLLKPNFSRQGRRRVITEFKRKVSRRWNSKSQYFNERIKQNLHAMQTYTAVECHTDTLMISSGTFSTREHYLERWKSLTKGNLELVVFDTATHIEMLVDDNKYVEPMGKAITDYLDRTVYAQ